jgi:hypothetical protein
MRRQLLLSSAAVLVVLSYGASAQNTGTGQTSGSTTTPSAQSTTPPSSSGKTGTSSSPSQTSPSGSAATSTTPPASGTTSQATTPPSGSNAATSSQTPSTNATGAGAQPNTTQNSGTAATNPPPTTSGTAQRSNSQAPSGAASQTGAQAPSTQQQTTQPNTNTGSQQATQPNTNAGAQATQPNGSAQQNAQHNQAPGGVVSLNVQQRTQLGQTIARHNVKPVTDVNFSISVGTAVPRSIQLNALPADLVTIVPQYRGYSYFVVEEQIVIVEPSSVQIVAVIPYSGGTATRAAAPAPTKSRAVKLSTEEREVIRKHTSARRSSDAPAPAPARGSSRRYSVGDEVETTETIEEFPETVYREAPSVRRYRYLRQDNDVILVDPEDHRVVDVFD